MDELAFGPTSETSAFGPTMNPNDTDHVAGGSSSGSGSAVAAGEADLALGSDTGGSVRIPASYCGVVGFKPSYGLVPSDGFVEMAYSMDHIGPIARDVETVAIGLDVIADSPPEGHDGAYSADLGTDLSELTIGIPEQLFEEYVSAPVDRSVRDAVARMADAGATVIDVDIPGLEYSREAWWGIAPIEFAAAYLTHGIGLWHRDRVEKTLATGMGQVRRAKSHLLGSNVKEMVALGTYLLEHHDGYHYIKGMNLREDIIGGFTGVLTEVDVLAAPSTPTTALELGGFERGVTPPVNWNTHPTNLTGHPSVSLPCDDVEGLPVGLQLIGPMYEDKHVLDIAYSVEQELGYS